MADSVGLVLIQGAEGLLADRAISKILATNPAATITTLIADEIEVGTITDSLAPSLFGDARIVVIKEIQDLVADCSDEIIEYLSEPDESLNRVLWHKGGVKGKALVDKVKKAGAEVISAEAIKKDSDKAEFVRGEFKSLGRKISTEAVQALIDALGSDLRELGGACSQLASDVQDGKLIDEDDVVAYQRGRIETTGYGKTALALISLRNAINTGTDPVLIVSAIAASIRTMAKVSGAPRGLKSYDLASQLGLPPWQIDKARRQLSGWSENALARSVITLAQADADIKGAAADPAYALERAIITISTARGSK